MKKISCPQIDTLSRRTVCIALEGGSHNLVWNERKLCTTLTEEGFLHVINWLALYQITVLCYQFFSSSSTLCSVTVSIFINAHKYLLSPRYFLWVSSAFWVISHACCKAGNQTGLLVRVVVGLIVLTPHDPQKAFETLTLTRNSLLFPMKEMCLFKCCHVLFSL